MSEVRHLQIEPGLWLIVGIAAIALTIAGVWCPWRAWLFRVCHRGTRSLMRWRLGPCTELSYGLKRPCILWRGHASAHRSDRDTRWVQASRRQTWPPR